MKIVAIDPSLTSLGYAHTTASGVVSVGTVRPKKLKGAQRLAFLRDEVEAILDRVKPDLVPFEGYAMGARGNNMFSIGEMGGVLKLALFERKIPVLLVPPSCLKLFVTGKGNADKDQIMVVMAKHRGRLFASDDEADAYALLQMGVAYSDARQRPRDPRHFKCAALRGCELVEASAG